MLSSLRRIGYGSRSIIFTRTRPHLHAMVVSCGYSCETSSDYDWHGLRRGKSRFVLFQYTLSGKGMLRCNGMEYEVGPGMAMVLHFPCDNRYWLPRGWGPWEFVYTCMNGAEVLRAWQEIERAAGPIIRCEAGSSPVVLVSQLYEDAMKSRIATPFDASSRAYQMAMALEQVAYHRNAGTNRPAGISRVIDFCQANFRGAIGIDDLAAVSGFSRYHFCRTFRRIEGITPLDHLTGVRIRHAAQLLAGGMHSVKEAAFESGFSEPNYFCKVFRKKMGIAPGEFRRSGMYSSAH